MSDHQFSLVVRNGRVVLPTGVVKTDIGIEGGLISAIGGAIAEGETEIDAADRFVVPGGIDPHAHVEQVSANGLLNADSFESATTSAAFGGTTSLICFAAQHRGMSLDTVVADYHALARRGALIDYSFHMIIGNPDETTLGEDLPKLIREGHTSIKIFMTYDRLKLDDEQILDILHVAKTNGALVCVHAENHAMIGFMGRRLFERGQTGIAHFCESHPRLAEVDAIQRLAVFSEFLDQPIMVFHVSTREGADAVARAQVRGVKLSAETCPQYLFLTEADVVKPGLEGAKWMCSPPLRRTDDQEALWTALERGILDIVSSDHAPYRFDESGKLSAGANPTFKQIANGLPGVELRLPLLFDAMVSKGRMGIERFVDVTSTAPARHYGLIPRKGLIAPGADADLVLWNPDKTTTLTGETVHDRAGYTPYEGRTVTGWPEIVISRGRIIISDGTCHAEPGSGQFLARQPRDA
jgi:dihydropyrimidinase